MTHSAHKDEHLANPYWYALCTTQSEYAEGGSLAKRFPQDVIPFAGVASHTPQAFTALHNLLAPGEQIFVTSDATIEADGLEQTALLPGIQMVYRGAEPAPEEVLGEPLTEADVPDMLELKRVAFPGYFGPRAASLGRFFGIRVEGQLVAMAGERLALPGYREVSAVCTHPDFTGRGYAAGLIRQVIRAQRRSGETTFLGVLAASTRAIALYERLGFVKTRELTWRHLKRS